MGTISEKLTYLNVTKQKLKQAINNIGGEVTDETTFREYVNQLENAYDNLPKTSYAEGSNITLSNTLKGKLDFEDGIVGIGDTSQKSYTGKNLYPSGTSTQTIAGVTFTPQEDGSLKLNGTSTYSNYYVAGGESNYVQVENLSNIAETVTLSVSGIHQEGIQVYVVGSTLGPNGLAVNGSTTFTTTLNDTYRIFVRVMAGTIANSTIKIQLEKGSSATSFEKYVGGTASPNPSYPQDIEVVRGKNRFGDTLRQGVTNYQTGTYNANNATRITTTNWLTLSKGTYTISAKNSANKLLQISNITFDTNGNYYEISGTTGQWKNMPFTITFPQDTRWQCNLGYSDGSNIIPSQVSEIQIEKGSQATSYLPYNTLEVVERGKNLAHIEAEGKYRSSASGNFSINANYNGYIANVRQNTTYTGGFTNMSSNYNDVSNLCYFDKNMIFISGEAYNTANKTFTTPSNCAYVTMAVKTTIIDFQLEEGSTATTYEPYQTPQTYQLSLGEYEFAKIGDYRDYIYKNNGKWYKHKAINKVTLNGSENWVLNKSGNNYIYTLSITDYLREQVNISYCDHFICVENGTFGSMTNNQCRFRYYNDSNYSLYICFNDITTVTDFKNWLSTHNVVLYYILATATDTEITDTTLIEQLNNWYNSQSFTGTTRIEINGQLPLIIKVRGLKGE